MTPPEEDACAVYETCISGITDIDLLNRLRWLSFYIRIEADRYMQHASDKKLYKILPNNCKNDDVVNGEVTKQELKDVYSIHMVGRSKAARNIYDSLLSRAPLGICPFCGFGHADTLDHYLPKAKYPQLSVLPINLVPSCRVCNTGKSTSIASTAAAQVLHPYFDHQNVINDQWLFATVSMSSYPPTCVYFIKTPEHWDDISKARIYSHFNDFKLASRFSIEAAKELANQKYSLDEFKRKHGIYALIDMLSDMAKSHYKNHVNSWQTAFYQALVDFNVEEVSELEKKTEICPVCEGEGVFVNYPCPFCKGNRYITKREKSEIDISEYEYLKCVECSGSVRCHLCPGNGFISRIKALQLTRNRP